MKGVVIEFLKNTLRVLLVDKLQPYQWIADITLLSLYRGHGPHKREMFFLYLLNSLYIILKNKQKYS